MAFLFQRPACSSSYHSSPFDRFDYWGDERLNARPLELGEAFSSLLAYQPKQAPPQPKVWRSVIDVGSYKVKEVAVSLQGATLIVTGSHAEKMDIEGDFDKREMRQTISIPSEVPVDRCTLQYKVCYGKLIMELREKPEEPKEKEPQLAPSESNAVVEKPAAPASVIPGLSSLWSLREKQYEMDCNLAGFKPESVDVKVDETAKTVTVKGEEQDDHSYKSFLKTVSLPDDMKVDTLRSILGDGGMLKITVDRAQSMEE